MNLKEQKALYLNANETYVQGADAIMSDAEFDKLEQAIRKVDPDWKHLHKTGAKPDKKTEVALEHFMPSLTKFYPEKIDKWLASRKDLLIMNKLDGSSVQLIYDKGVPVKLITRGDGTNGGDISFLLPHLNVPKSIKFKGHLVFRCEAVMSRYTFDLKYGKEFQNARNFVNGLLNRMTPHKALADVDIIVLGIYDHEIYDGLQYASKQGFRVVAHSMYDIYLSDRLSCAREASFYDMDGLVLCEKSFTLAYTNADKAKNIIAYKENVLLEEATVATVVEIIWQTSAKLRLIPKIKIKPVRIGGTTVTYATCHNAEWMLARSIGPGAQIQIVRSGDVIPKIVGVLKKGTLQLPDVPYKQVGVHFVAIEQSKEDDVRAIHKFFTR